MKFSICLYVTKTFSDYFSINIYLPNITICLFPIPYTLSQWQADHYYVFISSIWWPSSLSFFGGGTTFKSIFIFFYDIIMVKILREMNSKMISTSKMLYNWQLQRRNWIRNEIAIHCERWAYQWFYGTHFQWIEDFTKTVAHSAHPNGLERLAAVQLVR